MGTRVYIGGLPRDATSREVQDAFSRYGYVSNIWIARNPPGFAFIDFEDPRDADDAIRSMDGRDFLGGRIRVEIARGGSRRDREGGGGRGGGEERKGRNPPQRTDFKVRVSDLPRGIDWRNVKDYLRTGGEVTFCDIESDGTAVAEFMTKNDMDDAIKKLDDTEFRGNYIRVQAESGAGGGSGGRRSRSRSPRRDRRSRSRSNGRRESPRRDRRSRSRSGGDREARSPRRSRSKSPAASSPPPRKNSV